MSKKALPETIIEATLHDGAGPRLRRMIMPGLAALAFVLAPFASLWAGEPSFATLLILSGAVLAMLARVVPPRPRPARARLACSKGSVRVEDAGLLDQTLRAKDVVDKDRARFAEKQTKRALATEEEAAEEAWRPRRA